MSSLLGSLSSVRSYFAHFVFTIALAGASLARAQPVALPVLGWQAPAGCPDREQVRAALARWLHKAVDRVDARSLRVDARVRVDGNRWSLTLVLESPSGRATEQLTADRCETLVEVVGLKVMLAASAAAALQTLGAASGPATIRETAPRSLETGLRATLGLMHGVLPELGGLVGLAAALRLASARFELALSYAPPRAASYPEPAGVG